MDETQLAAESSFPGQQNAEHDIEAASLARRADGATISEEREKLINAAQLLKQKELRLRLETEEITNETRLLRRERAEFQLETEVLRAQRRKSERIIEGYRKLTEGTFFSSLDQVWKSAHPMDCTKAHFDALFRERLPTHGHIYVETVEAAMNKFFDVGDDDDDSSTQSEDTEDRRAREKIIDSVWPTDMFGNDNPAAKLGHLIPDSCIHASMYDDVATWALGWTPENLLVDSTRRPEDIWVAKQKAIHGVRAVDGSNMLPTGLKHSQCNMLRLCSPDYFIENNPCVVIVPVMTVDQVKNWNGEQYDALVLPEAWGVCTTRNVWNGIGMHEFGPGASTREIEVARQLLEHVLCGLTYSLLCRDRPYLRQDSANLLAQYRLRFPEAKVTVPIPTGEHSLRVKRITFGQDEQHHPAPDPLLLAVKAAVIWSKRQGQQLLACGESDDDASSLSTQAEEEYRQRFMRAPRPMAREDLAAGLGQPRGDSSDESDGDEDLAVGLGQPRGDSSDESDGDGSDEADGDSSDEADGDSSDESDA